MQCQRTSCMLLMDVACRSNELMSYANFMQALENLAEFIQTPSHLERVNALLRKSLPLACCVLPSLKYAFFSPHACKVLLQEPCQFASPMRGARTIELPLVFAQARCGLCAGSDNPQWQHISSAVVAARDNIIPPDCMYEYATLCKWCKAAFNQAENPLHCRRGSHCQQSTTLYASAGRTTMGGMRCAALVTGPRRIPQHRLSSVMGPYTVCLYSTCASAIRNRRMPPASMCPHAACGAPPD